LSDDKLVVHLNPEFRLLENAKSALTAQRYVTKHLLHHRESLASPRWDHVDDAVEILKPTRRSMDELSHVSALREKLDDETPHCADGKQF